ncbi:hypothetical protein [Algisphaera agarilytica]|uniref:Uncharacterized protein n=1 Tax=Algisphaera agarilytica TaxID=1385975 RepID=A0A7X0H7E3_9BACT|nr:hypothetical protein [Algisphaera agarilytica]MBB6430624.1 hypothetical protein [Algisphaera agarilytica]
MLSVCVLLTTMGLGAIPELTEPQQIQLDTAQDGYLPDEPAWTGLLTSVSGWDPAEAVRNDIPGSTIPQYSRLLETPAAYRGGLFHIKGFYAGRQRELRTMRSGPWGESLVEWGVAVDSDTVAMVYLVSPDSEIQPPREGQTVRLTARFYKLWTDTDADGVERTYPVFVGRSAAVVDSGRAGGRGHVVVVGGVVVLTGLLFLVMLGRKRWGGGASKRERVLERLRDHAGEAEMDEELNGLPDDPAEALEQLDRGRDV